jgi:hypothetical protein
MPTEAGWFKPVRFCFLFRCRKSNLGENHDYDKRDLSNHSDRLSVCKDAPQRTQLSPVFNRCQRRKSLRLACGEDTLSGQDCNSAPDCIVRITSSL